jgi:hypothetical protein
MDETAPTDSQRLLSLRHKLQRIFLSAQPLVSEYEKVNHILTQVEQFPMTYTLLKETKIGKVVKRISAMELEQGGPSNVIERCGKLVGVWKGLIPVHGGRESTVGVGDVSIVCESTVDVADSAAQEGARGDGK